MPGKEIPEPTIWLPPETKDGTEFDPPPKEEPAQEE